MYLIQMKLIFKITNQTPASLLSLHGDGFQRVVIGGTGLHLLFKAKAILRLVPEVEVVRVVLRRVNGHYAPRGERNVDVKHPECETRNERRQ